MKEVWKEHPIYNNFELSNKGKMRNKETGKLLKGTVAHNGYVRMGFMFNGEKLNKALHRLIMEAFVGFDDRQVNHKDGVKTSNHLYNLEYCTRLENIDHARINGLTPSGENMYNASFTNEQVEQICICFSEGLTNKETATRLGLGYNDLIKASLSRIRNRVSYTNITKNYKWLVNKQVQYPEFMIVGIINKIISGYKYKNIALSYPEYDFKKLYNLIKKIGSKNIYYELFEKIEKERSTTIEMEFIFLK